MSFRIKAGVIGPSTPYVRNADSGVDVPEHPLEKFVRQNARSIGKAEQAMIGENRADAEQMCVQDALVSKGGQTCVRVNESDTLAEDDGAEIREECKEVRQCGGRHKGGERYMIDLQSRHEPAHANAVGWMAVSDDYNLSELNTTSNWIKGRVPCDLCG